MMSARIIACFLLAGLLGACGGEGGAVVIVPTASQSFVLPTLTALSTAVQTINPTLNPLESSSISIMIGTESVDAQIAGETTVTSSLPTLIPSISDAVALAIEVKRALLPGDGRTATDVVVLVQDSTGVSSGRYDGLRIFFTAEGGGTFDPQSQVVAAGEVSTRYIAGFTAEESAVTLRAFIDVPQAGRVQAETGLILRREPVTWGISPAYPVLSGIVSPLLVRLESAAPELAGQYTIRASVDVGSLALDAAGTGSDVFVSTDLTTNADVFLYYTPSGEATGQTRICFEAVGLGTIGVPCSLIVWGASVNAPIALDQLETEIEWHGAVRMDGFTADSVIDMTINPLTGNLNTVVALCYDIVASSELAQISPMPVTNPSVPTVSSAFYGLIDLQTGSLFAPGTCQPIAANNGTQLQSYDVGRGSGAAILRWRAYAPGLVTPSITDTVLGVPLLWGQGSIPLQPMTPDGQFILTTPILHDQMGATAPRVFASSPLTDESIRVIIPVWVTVALNNETPPEIPASWLAQNEILPVFAQIPTSENVLPTFMLHILQSPNNSVFYESATREEVLLRDEVMNIGWQRRYIFGILPRAALNAAPPL